MHIKKLTLFTNRLEEMKSFYVNKIGFHLYETEESSFTLKIGSSFLIFEYSEEAYYYHFAFNIPSFQENEALNWLKDRVEILKDGEEEIVDFKHWNAKALYFKDPAENIVELIARRNLNISASPEFDVESIINISEIGYPVENVSIAFEELTNKYALKKFSGDLKRFAAIGDDFGLFIIVTNKKKWFPTENTAKYFPFKMDFQQGHNKYTIDLTK